MKMITNGEPQAARQAARLVTIDAEHAGRRLDNFLGTQLGKVPRALVYRMIRGGEVRVNGSRATPAQRLQPGDRVRVPPHFAADAPDRPFSDSIRSLVLDSVLWENRLALLLNKPAGLAVHAGSGLPFGVVDVVRALRPDAPRVELVHRLDRETSGCLLLAKDASTLRALHAQLREGRMEKRYQALLHGRLPRREWTCDAPLAMVPDGRGERRAAVAAEGQSARTLFRAVALFPCHTLVEVVLDTGRTHQIRAHAAHLGCPVAGDARYGDAEGDRVLRNVGLSRLFLHADQLGFECAGHQRIDAPLPPDLRRVLEALDKESASSAHSQEAP